MAEDPRTHHGEVPWSLRGAKKEPCSKGRVVSVQDNQPTGRFNGSVVQMPLLLVWK